MTGQQQQGRNATPAGEHTARGEILPYRIELWDAVSGQTVERVLARAMNAALARAIFKAALTEHPDRRITLCRGARTMSDSWDLPTA